MIILRNQSKHPTWLLKLILTHAAETVDYEKPLIVRVHDNCTGQAGETHQGNTIHTVELEAPYAHTETPHKFLFHFLHELCHLLDLDFDPERKILFWTPEADRAKVLWHNRPEEIRADMFAGYYFAKLKFEMEGWLQAFKEKTQSEVVVCDRWPTLSHELRKE